MIATSRQRLIERGIWVYLAWFFLLSGLAWLPFFAHGRSQNFFPLSELSERFGDLAHFASVPQKLANPNLENYDHLAGTMFPRNYGPLATLLYLFFLRVCSPYGIVVFLLVAGGIFLLGAFFLWRAARRSPGYRPFMMLAIFGTSLFAFPTIETGLRGNLEDLVWIGYAAGIGYMFMGKWSKSASVIAILSCIKPYPTILLVLLFWRRKYKQLVLAGFVLLATTLGSLVLLGRGDPKLGMARISGSGGPFFDNYIVGFRGVSEAAADHSLFQTSKSITRVVKARGFHLLNEEYLVQPSQKMGYVLLAIYVPFAGLFLLWTLSRIRKKPFLTQVFSLSICLTLFPLIAADYTLTILYIPMGLFLLFLLRDVATGRSSISDARLRSILIPCAWLVAPQPLFGLWKGDLIAMILLFLLFVVMDTPMPMAIDEEEGSGLCREMVELGQASGA